jgi:tetratricopeptide (TPR) repeat protein
MKAEIDALQIDVLKSNTPWYRQASTLVALFALLFSTFTAGLSLWITHQQSVEAHTQRVNDTRTELRSVIQRLLVLDSEQARLRLQYAENPAALASFLGTSNQEAILLADEAWRTMQNIPGKATAPEYYTIARALASNSRYAESIKVAEEGLSLSQDPLSRVALLRQIGIDQFNLGQFQDGSLTYARAVQLIESDHSNGQSFINQTNAFTEAQWANQELSAKHCAEADRLLTKAENRLSNQPFVTQVRAAFEESC